MALDATLRLWTGSSRARLSHGTARNVPRNQSPLPLKVGNVVEVLHDGGTGWASRS